MPNPIFTPDAPKPIGPYSQALGCANLIFISGQIPLDPKSGEIIGNSTQEQTVKVLDNIKAILNSQGLDFSSLVKTTVFLRQMEDFAQFNKIYEMMLEGAAPARSVVEVCRLPKDVLIEIEAVACR